MSWKSRLCDIGRHIDLIYETCHFAQLTGKCHSLLGKAERGTQSLMVYLIWLKQFIFDNFHMGHSNLATSILLQQPPACPSMLAAQYLKALLCFVIPEQSLKIISVTVYGSCQYLKYFLCLTILFAISDWYNIQHALSPQGILWERSAVRADYCSLLLRLLCSIQSLHTVGEHLSRDKFISVYFCNKSSIHLQSLPSSNSFLVKESLIFWLMH